ncbi:cell wall hydrolase [Bacillus salipaludis]|uniref:Cell wall hydrolase n=2 Tax=Bacillus salipaludis TaxID=2547811 RepID=A0AA90R462_9BACI|nr:cell wall hydrolase [Bacillus salipaludis]MDQ6596726.1 cell wall hydrolase [Bacillus salipaludis]
MKLIVSVFMTAFLFLFMLVQPGLLGRVDAQTLETVKIYKVHDETPVQVALKYGVSKSKIIKVNGIKNNRLTPGEKIIIPKQISQKEKDLLARLVTAEAKGEPYKGKVAVAAVVLNRVKNDQFPDSIHQVIYQKRQFQPVANGMINKPAVEDAKKAVNEALAKNGQITDALYFYNPDKTDSKWLRSKKTIKKIGHHRFAI